MIRLGRFIAADNRTDQALATLAQLLDRENYRPCDWDLVTDAAGRDYWIENFIAHLDVQMEMISASYPDADDERLAALRRDYVALMNSLRDAPARFGRLDVLMLDELRQELLVRHGFPDPFKRVKERENAAALALLPRLLAEIDAMPPAERPARLVEGLLAGNIFDLGSMPTVERYNSGEADFWHSLVSLPARPWFRDDLDNWQRRIASRAAYRHVLFFVDNAGGDIVLGCLPLARMLMQSGARVTLAANSLAALNDITADELLALIGQAAESDAAFADPRLRVVATGNRAPLIDLTNLTAECVATSADADLIILHGMGRSIESNYRAGFQCDALWTAVVKDEAVARHIGAELFDCVFRFEAGRSTR